MPAAQNRARIDYGWTRPSRPTQAAAQPAQQQGYRTPPTSGYNNPNRSGFQTPQTGNYNNPNGDPSPIQQALVGTPGQSQPNNLPGWVQAHENSINNPFGLGVPGGQQPIMPSWANKFAPMNTAQMHQQATQLFNQKNNLWNKLLRSFTGSRYVPGGLSASQTDQVNQQLGNPTAGVDQSGLPAQDQVNPTNNPPSNAPGQNHTPYMLPQLGNFAPWYYSTTRDPSMRPDYQGGGGFGSYYGGWGGGGGGGGGGGDYNPWADYLARLGLFSWNTGF